MVTETPIETLKRAQIYNCHSTDPEHCKLPICADARTALEDVEALLATLNAIVEKEELPESWNSDSWIDDNNYDAVHGHGMDAGAWYVAKQIRDALDKFQVKS